MDVRLKSIQYYISLLDQKKKAELSKEFDLIASEFETKFVNPLEHLPNYHIGLKTTVDIDLKALIEKGWGDVLREDVVKFKDKVLAKIDKFISAIFDDRVELATETIAKAIKFYNDFLEQQERYQQETPEQRETEKAWIDKQRQELARVQDGIHLLLNGN